MKKFLWIILLCIFLSVDICIATDGFVAYRSNTGASGTNSPKIRYWNNTGNGGNGSWSASDIELPSTGSPVRYLRIEQSPVSSKIVLVTLSDDGNLTGYVCMHNCTDVNNWDTTLHVGTVWTVAATQRRFDVAYETNNGDLLLVYGVLDAGGTHDIGYKVLYENTTSFNGLTEQYIDDTNHAGDIQYGWIAMDRDPVKTSNEIIMVGWDSTDSDTDAWVWDGSAWGNTRELTAAATGFGVAREGIAVKYAADGSKGMVVSGDGAAGNIQWSYWTGGAPWVSGVFDESTGGGNNNDAGFLTLKADPATDDLQLVVTEVQSVLRTVYWDGATWTISGIIDAGLDANAQRCADFDWEPTGSTGRLVWDSDTVGMTMNQTLCNPRCTNTFSAISPYAATGRWVSLYSNPSSSDTVKILGLRMNSLFDISPFRWNTTQYDRDINLTLDTTVATFDSYSFDYRRDVRPPNVTFFSPNLSGMIISNATIFFNITANEYLQSAILEWNGSTNYTMNGSDMIWNYTFTGLAEGSYTYKIYAADLAGNLNITEKRNITVDFPPNITLVYPDNNTLNTTSRNITFYYNATGGFGGVTNCSLVVDNVFVVNITGIINQTGTNNVTYRLTNGQHNWSIWCNDTYGVNASSETRNITVRITPVINSITLDDYLLPAGEIMLAAGNTRFVNCSVIVTDSEGPSNINNVTATFFYFLNKSSDPDDYTVHYSANPCNLTYNNTVNATFSCGFNVLYYANNGTWYCNAVVNNNYSINATVNISNIIQPLYAVNITDGIKFSQVQTNTPSANITANITNLGNMLVNITLQGYALVIGDSVGMNCTDGTNVTITNIRFSVNNTADFNSKIQLNGAIQPINFQIQKQMNATPMFNTTYWQIQPDPGSPNRYCTGRVLFTAQAP